MSKGSRKELENLRKDLSRANQRIESLQYELRQLNNITDLVKEVVIVTDQEGFIINSSPTVVYVLGYEGEDLIGRNYKEFVHASEKIEFDVYLKKITPENSASLLHRFKTKSKKYIWIEITGRFNKENKTKISFYLRDLSERMKLQNDLIISHQRYKSLIENLPFVVFRYNRELKHIYVSPNVSELLPFQPEDLMGSEFQELGFDDDKVEFFNKSIHEVFENAKKIEREFEQETQKGLLILNWKLIPEFDEKGKVMTVLGIIEDITQQKRNFESALLYQQIYNNNEDGIAILNTDGSFREINYAFSNILGYDIQDLNGKTSEVFLGEKTYSEVFRVFEFQSIFEGELLSITKQGKKIYLDILMFPVKSENETLCLVQIIRDITQRKNSEKTIIEAKRRAEEADKLKTAFLSNMSHEIRTPMNSILGFAGLLKNPEISDNQRKRYIDFISKNGESLLNLIGDIIDIAKIESNQLSIQKSICKVHELLEELKESLTKVKDMEGKESLELKMGYDVRAPLILYTDSYRLRQILVNLIYNAIKFTNEGHVEFGYEIAEEDSVIFHVKDTGIGIPEEMQEKIFARFHKLENSRKKLYGGAGLGLAISGQLVKLLGGKIWLESAVGKGSSFYFTVPNISIPEEKIPEPEARNKKIALNWISKKILIVEDDIFSVELINEYLASTEISILHTDTGNKAVEIVKENPDIDLVIMDIQLPEMNGIEAAELIKKVNSSMPVIAQTAFAMDEDKPTSKTGIFDAYLIKPLVKDFFLEKLAGFLNTEASH